MATWTVIDEQAVRTVEAGDEPVLDPRVLGWEPKPEGLCRDDVCIPVPGGAPAGALDAHLLGRLLGRPVVVDEAEHAVAFGASAAERAASLRTGIAPDFELPDVDGRVHRLRDHRGRKVVLYAWGSW
jgi:hypothetical protein